MLNANEVPSGGGNFPRAEPLEPGTYPARLVGIINLGTQAQNDYMGEAKPPVMTMQTTYELLDEFLKNDDGEDDEERPRWISEDFPFYSLKSEKAKSTKRYLALDPDKEFEGDWTQLVDVPCMVTLIAKPSAKDKNIVYNNVTNVSAMRPKEALKAPELVNSPFLFDFYDPDMTVWEIIPKWTRDKIMRAVDFKGSLLETKLREAPSKNDDEDEAPKVVKNREKKVTVDDEKGDGGW